MREGWTRHEGLAVGLARENVDTDQIIPARFMSAPRKQGYGRFLLHDLRFDEAGAPRPDSAFDAAAGASVLVARRNFGGGSSREAAVYALVDYGIRAVLAPSFGDIFQGNAVNNGLLPARIDEDDAERLLTLLAAGSASLRIDLETAQISGPDVAIAFALDPIWRTKLVNGWDDIDLTASHTADIARFRDRVADARPWVWPPERADGVATR